MDQLLSEFLDDAEVLIDGLAKDVLALHAQGQDGRERRELIARIFRHAHTLKGSSAAFELTEITNLTHELENLLDAVRSGRATVDDSVIDTLGDAVSTIYEMIGAVGCDERLPVPTLLVERLREHIQVDTVEQQALKDHAPSGLSEIAGTLSEAEEHRLSEALKEGAGAYMIEVAFEVALFDTKFKELSEELGKCGEIISTQPGIHASQADQIAFRILYATEIPVSQLTAMLAQSSPVELEELVARSARDKERLVRDVNVAGGVDPVPVARTVARAVRAGTVAARATGKEIDFEIQGGEVILDKSVSDAIMDSLLHLVRNAVDHGIELPSERKSRGKSSRGLIKLVAMVEENHVRLSIIDDGRGIDPKQVTRTAIERGLIHADTQAPTEECFRLIFVPGFSTAETVSTMSGRGVGLDVVERAVEQVGGKILVQSDVGVGTSFELILPLTTTNVSS